MDAIPSMRATVRASDRDRERAVAALRRHYTAGRLEMVELEQRVESAYAARWRGDLRALFDDMPFEPPTIDRARLGAGVDRLQRSLLHAHVIFWTIFNTVLLAIWAWGGGDDAWPLIVALPMTLLLLWHARASRAVSRRLVGPGEGPRGALPGPRRRALL